MKRKSKLDSLFIIFFLVGISVIYSYIAVISHNHFQTFAWDLGFFDQIIWKASHGDLVAYSTIAHENLLADHFQPVLYLLSPLYKIISDVRMILIAQAILVVSAALPLYLLAKSVSKNIIFSFAVVFAYLFFLGTQWTILNEFHQAAFIPLFLITIFYSLDRKNIWGYWLGIAGLLATKEELGLLVGALGLLVWWRYKWKKTGVIAFVVGILSFFFLIYFLMPKLSVRSIYSHFDLGDAGYTPVDAIKKSLTSPTFFIKSMIYPYVKVRTVFDSFFAFGFLPLFNPIFLLPIIENFAARFIYAGPQFTKWVNVNHHAAPLGILLSVGSIYSSLLIAQMVEKRKKIKVKTVLSALGLYLIFISIAQNLLLHGPVNSIFKSQFYETQNWMKDNYEVIAKVPKDSSVAAQNSMLPHVSQRQEVYLLPELGNAEYVLLDLQDGPNKFSPLNYTQMKDFVRNLLNNGQYLISYQKGDAMLLKRIQ